MNLYAAADKAIREMNRANLKAFNRLKLAKFDELQVIRQIADTYDASIVLAKKKYLDIAIEAYIEALIEAEISRKRAQDMADDDITTDWVLDMLEESDPVTLYEFLSEAERKKQRLIEAIAASQNKSAEIDKALRYWTKQLAQYADNTVFNARLDAFKAIGISKVKWVTQGDERVCDECEPLDGKVFEIDKVPPTPHWGCRCYIVPVRQ